MPNDDARLKVREFVQAPLESSRLVISPATLPDVLQWVVFLARSVVGETAGVSISLARDGLASTSNATDDVVRELDNVQYTTALAPASTQCARADRSRSPLSMMASTVVAGTKRRALFLTRPGQSGCERVCAPLERASES